MNASPGASRTPLLRLFRAHSRKALLGSLFVMLMLLAASVAHAATYTVTDTSDDVADTGSLRYALSQVNAGAGGEVINFSGVTGTITLGSTLAINESVTINGPGPNLLTVSGNDQVGVFSVAVATTVSISGLTIAHGFLGAGPGAGINSGAVNDSLTVNNCTLFNNVANGNPAFVGAGGAINAVVLAVNDSTFINNSAGAGSGQEGGAIYAKTATINNSTFVGNTAPVRGGAIYMLLGLQLTVNNSTFVGNGAATDGGIGIKQVAPTKITNSIISGNTGGDCSLCSTTGTNLIGGTAALGPLQYNGGPTQTMAPLPSGTGIIGAGLNSTLATDQRGIPRPTSGASDLGAVQSYNLVVTTTDDSTNSSSTCDGSDTCSLRDALNLANTQGAGDVVTVGGLQGTINLTSSLPNDTADLNINGPGANQLTISGGGSYGIFNITNPAAVTNISGVTIANGNSGSPGGGGITNLGTSLTLNNCEMNNNQSAGQDGGALFNSGSSTASVLDCTFSGNSSDSGGAINNNGLITITNSTFNGNTAHADYGGGIFNQGAATVTSSTITGNNAATDGGGIDNVGTLTVSNSIVAGNSEPGTPNDDCGSCGTQTAYNLFSTPGAPISGAQVMLGALAYNGPNQTVRTMLPIPGNPVMQAGDPTQLPGDLTTDERQLPRTINSKLDMGAVETNYTAVQFVQQPSDATVGSAISPSVSLSITESGVTAPNIPLTVSFTGNGNLDGTLTETTVAPANPGDPAVATFTGLSVDAAGTGDVLNANVTITPPGITPAQTLTATSNPFDITQVTADVPAVTVGPSSPVYGQPDTVNITVPTTGGTPPTGTVTVYNNGNPIGTGTLGPDGTVTVIIPGGTLPAGSSSITVGYAGDANYGTSTSTAVPVTVAPVVSGPTVAVGPASPVAGQPATVTVTVPTIGDTPASGTVTIYDNGNSIGTGTLGSDGTVTVNIPGGLPAGSNMITAGYAGAGNYASATSAPTSIAVTALDFTLTRTSPASQTVISGQVATIAVQVAPTYSGYPGVVSFAASGLPAGSTAIFTPATVAANGGTAPVNLSIQTAPLLSANRLSGGGATTIALGLLLLPFAGKKRRQLLNNGRMVGRSILMVLVLLAGTVASVGLTGCVSGNGFFGHAPKTYNVTITATSGTIQHSVTATLNVQ